MFFFSFCFWFFFFEKFFKFPLFGFFVFSKDFLYVEDDDLWISSNLFFWDNQIINLNDFKLKLTVSERDVFFTLVYMFFDKLLNDSLYKTISRQLYLKRLFKSNLYFVSEKPGIGIVGRLFSRNSTRYKVPINLRFYDSFFHKTFLIKNDYKFFEKVDYYNSLKIEYQTNHFKFKFVSGNKEALVKKFFYYSPIILNVGYNFNHSRVRDSFFYSKKNLFDFITEQRKEIANELEALLIKNKFVSFANERIYSRFLKFFWFSLPIVVYHNSFFSKILSFLPVKISGYLEDLIFAGNRLNFYALTKKQNDLLSLLDEFSFEYEFFPDLDSSNTKREFSEFQDPNFKLLNQFRKPMRFSYYYGSSALLSEKLAFFDKPRIRSDLRLQICDLYKLLEYFYFILMRDVDLFNKVTFSANIEMLKFKYGQAVIDDLLFGKDHKQVQFSHSQDNEIVSLSQNQTGKDFDSLSFDRQRQVHNNSVIFGVNNIVSSDDLDGISEYVLDKNECKKKFKVSTNIWIVSPVLNTFLRNLLSFYTSKRF